jgi:hypothetical protein
MRSMSALIAIALLVSPLPSHAFCFPASSFVVSRSRRHASYYCYCHDGCHQTSSSPSRVALSSSVNDNNDNSNDNSDESDNLDAMRNMLEASWNTQTMGAVPTNPNVAAAAAGE